MKVLVICADGVEEAELVIAIDVLRRAKLLVTLCAVQKNSLIITNGGLKIEADELFDNIDSNTYECVVIPGGMRNTETLCKNTAVLALLKEFASRKKLICAICAAPLVLKSAGVLPSKFTCYPSLSRDVGSNFVDESVVVCDRFITSQSPGTAFEFAFSIVKTLCGEEKVNRIVNGKEDDD